MKVKTPISLAEDVLEATEEQAGPEANKAGFIETTIRAYIRRLVRQRPEAQ